jgi:YD repeat-containing protein
MRRSGERPPRWRAKYFGYRRTPLAAVAAACGMACLVGPAGSPAVALGVSASSVAGSAASSAEGTGAPLPPGGPPVRSGWPFEAEGLQAERQSLLSSPAAVAAREASRMRFHGLGAARATQVTREAFPEVIDESAGGPPRLPAGQRIKGFLTADAAQIELGGGQRAVVESTVPMAIRKAGGWAPVDLAPHATSAGFAEVAGATAVGIPRRLASGVRLSGAGVSVTPVDASGAPLGGEGALDGAVVAYANTQTDADTLVKPTTLGFDLDTVLRSVASPQRFTLRIGLPAGARLVRDGASGAVRVVKEDATIASVSPPVAHDAAGTGVPVTMTVAGDTLVLNVDHRLGSYQYPIELDPEFNNRTEAFTLGNWHFGLLGTGFTHNIFEFPYHEVTIWHKGSYPAEDHENYAMQTNGDSRIYEGTLKTWFFPHGESYPEENYTYPFMQGWVEIAKEGVESHKETLTGKPYVKEAAICANESCSTAGGTEHNELSFDVGATESSAKMEGEGKNTEFGGSIIEAATYISQPKETHATVSYNGEAEITYKSGGKEVKAPNVLYTHGWLGPNSPGVLEFKAHDAGLGVAETNVTSHIKGSEGWAFGITKNYLTEGGGCIGIQCAAEQREVLTYAALAESPFLYFPNGEDKLRVSASDPMEHTSSLEHGEGETTVKIDSAPPHGVVLTGLTGKGEAFELGEVEAHVKGEATDGEGTTPSSGIKSLALYVDGREVGKAAGSCPVGPCSASAEWAINGAELGAGVHTIAVQAVDNADNYELSKEYTLVVSPASPTTLGPGSVNPESGDFAMGTNDVSLSGGAGSLTVTRHYDSRNTKEGEEGPLGPQWAISLGSLASLEVLPDRSVMVTGPAGLTHFTKKTGGGFEAPEGDTKLTLESVSNEKKEVVAYLLKDPTQGTTTEFTLPKGAKSWMPTVSKGPVATNTTTDTYATEEVEGKTIVKPTLELAPHPSATCEPKKVPTEKTKMEKGCRALEFIYAEKTKESIGENRSEWGEYKGRLKEIIAIAYNPEASVKAMVEPAVAKYEYDKQGRLRAEWDPRISPELKAVYGYDAEGHITAVTPPGKESVTLTYGTIAGDPSAGRLVKETQASASASLWGGEMPKNTAAPAISGVARQYVRLAVSNGTWSGSPVSYGYQWKDCNSKREECTLIPGATNANYTVTASDVGHTLVAQVTATNGGGSVTALASAEVKNSTEYPLLSSSSRPIGITSGPDGNLWVTGGAVSAVSKVTTGGAVSEYDTFYGSPSDIVAGPEKESALWFTAQFGERVQKITTTGEQTTVHSFGPETPEPLGITVGPDNNVWFAMEYANKIGKLTTAGVLKEYALPSGSKPTGITSGPDGNLWFTDSGTGRIGKITPTGEKTEYGASSSEKEPFAIVAGPEKENALWFTERGAGKIGRITTSGTISNEYTLPAGSKPRGITVGPEGNLWFTDFGTSEIGRITPSGAVTEYALPSGSTPEGITTGPDKNIWFTDRGTGKVAKLTPAPTEGAVQSPGPGTTVEYNVPLEGSEAPQQMGVNKETGKPEPEKWGQKDDPVYATAIISPDEPQGWPASKYTRATILYLDGEAHTVNVAGPTGAISTTEYNEENEVKRTLSADNRAAALTEANPAQAAELLDTRSAYNSEGQLTDTWGPQHEVKLVAGKEGKPEETLARNHVKYHYDESAPAGEETYDLVTKIEDGAETASKAEFDRRTATTSYGGQSNLGWKLREPTSTTTDPEGLDLTTTTKYDENTGNVVETQSPAAAGKDAKVPPAFGLKFGSGAGEGALAHPADVSLDSSGNVWVANAYGNQIDKYSGSGAFIAAYGEYGSSESEVQFREPVGLAVNTATNNVYVGDQNNDRVVELNSSGGLVRMTGKAGEGAGQFEEADGVGIDPSGNVWVADYKNNRVEEFSEKLAFVKAVGWGVSNGEAKLQVCTSSCRAGLSGTGNGELSQPDDVAFSGSNMFVSDGNNGRVEEYNEKAEFVRTIGGPGSGSGQLKSPAGLAVDGAGNLYVADTGNSRVDKFSPTGTPLTSFGVKGSGYGQFEEPESVAVAATGALYVTDTGSNNRVQEWLPETAGSEAAHDVKTIYYTAREEAEVGACRNHIEWAGLPCQTKPVAQPGVSGLPELPVTTVTAYNTWNQPEVVTEVFGSGEHKVERTKKTTFDGAGRPLSSEQTSSIGASLGKVTYKYNSETGALTEQSTTVGETTKTIKGTYNTLGQLLEYTDADGNKATFEYEKEKDQRLLKVKDSKGSQTYHYNATTGFMTELTDSAAGTFKAEYDLAGKMTSEIYPNAMTAYYKHNQVGEATGIEYKKTAHCAKTCPEVWFSDTTVPSVHGETLKQTSTLAEEPLYTYDAAGRLTQVQEIPAGQGCKTRVYTYDEEGNRASETAREPGTEGKCAEEGGSTEWHTYDTANAMADAGVAYDTFGNTTKLPAADAGGFELTSEYYVDNQVAKQIQNGETIEYKLDPEDRTRETVSSGNTAATVVSHYDGSGGAIAWTSEASGAKWTRNIPGIGGTLAAVEHSGEETKPELQLQDLQGDVVATAAISETETKLLKTYNSTEFGVPSGKEAPPKYAWLGAVGVAGELPSGVITQDGVTYVPQTGRALQSESLAPNKPDNTPTMFVSTIESIAGEAAASSAQLTIQSLEVKHAEEEANRPPGRIPMPEGAYGCEAEAGGCGEEEESGGCTGMGACTASTHHSKSYKCHVKVMIGEERGKAWSRAWMSCGKLTMPANSFLFTCLTEESGDGFSPVGAQLMGCDNAVRGEQYPNQLYSNYEYGRGCPSEVSLGAFAGFWMPGWQHLKYAEAERGWTCGEPGLFGFANFVWFEVETLSELHPEG